MLRIVMERLLRKLQGRIKLFYYQNIEILSQGEGPDRGNGPPLALHDFPASDYPGGVSPHQRGRQSPQSSECLQGHRPPHPPRRQQQPGDTGQTSGGETGPRGGTHRACSRVSTSWLLKENGGVSLVIFLEIKTLPYVSKFSGNILYIDEYSYLKYNQ